MQPELIAVLERLLAGESVSEDSMHQAVTAVMDGRCSEAETAALLTALAVRGETAEEIAGAARAMREHAAHIRPHRAGLLDTCGTGGDRLHTFNISTATALVVAAAGVPVAKHGNRSVSSSSGSADVLEALGVKIDLPPDAVAQCIDEVGIGFCFARMAHAAMKHVAPVRARLGFRTIFNLLGPLTNPAGARRQLIGANSPETAEKLAHAMLRLGTERTLIVCGDGQLDEVALWGETTVFDVQGDNIQQTSLCAADFGLPECDPATLRVGSPQESAAVIRDVLDAQEAGPARNMVLANAAAALAAAGRTDDFQQGVQTASEAIESGAASRLVAKLAEWTQGQA